MHSASDHGYVAASYCSACGSADLHCCDGTGRRLSFDAWAAAVDAEICRVEGTDDNYITAPYVEMYSEGLTVKQAVERAYDGELAELRAAMRAC